MKFQLTLLAIICQTFFFGQETLSLEMQNGHSLPITTIDTHPSLPIIATGSQDHSIILWNTDSQTQLGTINASNSTILHIEYSKSGDHLLILNARNEVILFDIEKNEVLTSKAFELELEYIHSASFTNSPNVLAIGSNRNDLFLWNVENNELIISKKGFDTRVNERLVGNDMSYVSFSGAKSFNLIHSHDTLTCSFVKPNNYQFHPSKELIAVGSSKLFAGIFDTKTGKEIAHLEPNSENQCDGCNLKVFWNPSGTELATYDNKNGLYVWHKNFSTPRFKIAMTDRIEFYAYSESGDFIILSNDKTLWIVDTKKGKVVLKHSNKYLNEFEVTLSSNESTFFLPGDLFSLVESKVSNGTKKSSFKGVNNHANNQLPYDYLDWNESGSLRHYKQLSPMALSYQKDFLLIGKIGMEVQKIDLNTGIISTPIQSEKSVTAVVISQNDSLIAIGDASGNVMIYTHNNQLIQTFKNVHYGMVFGLAFDQYNTKIISTGWDGRTYILDLLSNDKLFVSESSTATNLIRTDEKNLYYFKSNLDNSLVMHEQDSHLEVRRFIGHTDKITDILYNDQSGHLFSTSLDGSIRVWDIASGLLIAKFFLDKKTPALSLTKHPTLPLLIVGGIDRKAYKIDLEKNEIHPGTIIHSNGISNLKFIDEKTVVARGLDGSIRFVDYNSLKERFSLYLYPENEWLAVEPESKHFEGTKKAMENVHLVNGTSSQNIGDFFNQYFTPNLVKQLLNGTLENKDQGRNIEDLFEQGVHFELTFQNSQNEYTQPIRDSIYKLHNSTLNIQVHLKEKVKYDDIYVYNNGKLIITESSDEEISFRGTNDAIHISVPLSPQNNMIEVKLIDKNQIEHSHFPVHLNFDTLAAKPDLYLVCLGINQYENKNYNLKYAKGDATEFLSSLEGTADNLYEKVYTYSLNDKKVTKENVAALIDEISKEIGPEDVFVFYYAGHGVMIENQKEGNDFYLVMSDVTNLYGGKEMLNAKGISSEELLSFSKGIAAQKQVFFLDACQSGAALDAFATRGVSREKAIAQLARSSGTFFITASQDIEYANEASSLQHGLFTYAILEILSGKVQTPSTGVLSIGAVKSYVEQRVPELSEQFKTSPQYPTGYSFGNDFPIGVLDPK